MNKFKGCSKCDYYSRSLGRCKLGMINPRTFKAAKEASRIMGASYICDKNNMITKLLRSQS